MKRIATLILLIILYVFFKYYFPITIMLKYPAILSILFSLMITFLILLVVTNIYSKQVLNNILNSIQKFAGIATVILLGSIFCVISLFFHFYIDQIEFTKNDLNENGIEANGILIDKYTTKQKRRGQEYVFTHVKVKYIVDGKPIFAEHNSETFETDLPNKNDSVKIIYSKNYNENFKIKDFE